MEVARLPQSKGISGEIHYIVYVRDSRLAANLQNRFAEIRQIIRLTAADKMAIDDHRRIFKDRSGIHEVIFDSG